MNIDDFPRGYACYQLRRTDYVPAQILGNFHDRELALQSLRSSRVLNPLATYDVVRAGVSIEKPVKKPAPLRLMRKAA